MNIGGGVWPNIIRLTWDDEYVDYWDSKKELNAGLDKKLRRKKLLLVSYGIVTALFKSRRDAELFLKGAKTAVAFIGEQFFDEYNNYFANLKDVKI
jgi:hypothetical protein